MPKMTIKSRKMFHRFHRTEIFVQPYSNSTYSAKDQSLIININAVPLRSLFFERFPSFQMSSNAMTASIKLNCNDVVHVQTHATKHTEWSFMNLRIWDLAQKNKMIIDSVHWVLGGKICSSSMWRTECDNKCSIAIFTRFSRQRHILITT